MKKVKVYTWTICPYCDRAKALLENRGIPFEEINLDGRDDELQTLRNLTGQRTIPQIFIGDEMIGGFTELAQLATSGELDRKLEG
ncbi:MAG: glutaredoxin 3 [Bdellovibrionales bacterium]